VAAPARAPAGRTAEVRARARFRPAAPVWRPGDGLLTIPPDAPRLHGPPDQGPRLPAQPTT